MPVCLATSPTTTTTSLEGEKCVTTWTRRAIREDVRARSFAIVLQALELQVNLFLEIFALIKIRPNAARSSRSNTFTV